MTAFKRKKILILGAKGLVGSALVRAYKALEKDLQFSKANQGIELLTPTHQELDLLNQEKTLRYFEEHKPDEVYLAAAKVGGIHANNTFRADFIFENLQIQNNVFNAAFRANTDKLLFLGSSCIYPKMAPQPLKEEYLLTGALEETNEPYAIAKIAGLKLAENFRRQYGKKYYAVQPTNLYGPGDNFHPENSHVIPGLIARMYKTISENKSTFEIWGTGTPKREFLYVDDMARACIHIMNLEEKVLKDIPYWINIGTGEDIAIKDLAFKIGEIMGFKGDYVFNTKYPDGTPQKLLDVSKIKALGWKPEITLEEGLKRTIEFYLKTEGN